MAFRSIKKPCRFVGHCAANRAPHPYCMKWHRLLTRYVRYEAQPDTPSAPIQGLGNQSGPASPPEDIEAQEEEQQHDAHHHHHGHPLPDERLAAQIFGSAGIAARLLTQRTGELADVVQLLPLAQHVLNISRHDGLNLRRIIWDRAGRLSQRERAPKSASASTKRGHWDKGSAAGLRSQAARSSPACCFGRDRLRRQGSTGGFKRFLARLDEVFVQLGEVALRPRVHVQLLSLQRQRQGRSRIKSSPGWGR